MEGGSISDRFLKVTTSHYETTKSAGIPQFIAVVYQIQYSLSTFVKKDIPSVTIPYAYGHEEISNLKCPFCFKVIEYDLVRILLLFPAD